uniref:Uncharacterized protein n=1 Tax=Populus trichocarpa TaxID=3694 RepID=A0A3N7FNX3_POPTR
MDSNLYKENQYKHVTQSSLYSIQLCSADQNWQRLIKPHQYHH